MKISDNELPKVQIIIISILAMFFGILIYCAFLYTEEVQIVEKEEDTSVSQDEPGKFYYSNDLKKCAEINYICEKGQKEFIDEKGCGCKIVEKDDDVLQDSGEARAVEIAMKNIENSKEFQEKQGHSLIVTNIIQMRCTGCWSIDMEYNFESKESEDTRVLVKMNLNNWEVSDVSMDVDKIEILSQSECEAMNGRAVNIVGGFYCNQNEEFVGEIEDFISPNICCVITQLIDTKPVDDIPTPTDDVSLPTRDNDSVDDLILPDNGSDDNDSQNLDNLDNELLVCEVDGDCIPLPSDCHPMECINSKFESEYIRPEFCTEVFMLEAAYKPEDCICKDNVCTNKNLGRKNL